MTLVDLPANGVDVVLREINSIQDPAGIEALVDLPDVRVLWFTSAEDKRDLRRSDTAGNRGNDCRSGPSRG